MLIYTIDHIVRRVTFRRVRVRLTEHRTNLLGSRRGLTIHISIHSGRSRKISIAKSVPRSVEYSYARSGSRTCKIWAKGGFGTPVRVASQSREKVNFRGWKEAQWPPVSQFRSRAEAGVTRSSSFRVHARTRLTVVIRFPAVTAPDIGERKVRPLGAP